MSLEEGPAQSSVPRAPVAGPETERTHPTELDEFLARAVDRQIAEQRALRETLNELSVAVKELQSKPQPPPPPPPPPAIDLADLDARIKRAMDANAQMFTSQLREFGASVVPSIERATASAMEGPKSARAIEHDLGVLRDALGGLSADVEGIAQALIDLNAGLRDWAEGVDRNIGGVRAAVDQVRDAAERTEQQQAEAAQQQADAMQRQAEAMQQQAVAIAAAEERIARASEEVAVGEVVDVEATGATAVPEPVDLAPPAEFNTEIERRVKETIELSLYLADQIEAFDKAIANLGDLPTRLEGVISQALKRTLAARAKLDREAEMALDEAVATLDEHVEHIGDLSATAETVRELADGQAELASGLAALAEAIDRASDGRTPRAASAVAKSTKRRAPERSPDSGAARRPARRKAAKSVAKAKRSSGARRKTAPRKPVVRRSAGRKTAATDYIDIDVD